MDKPNRPVLRLTIGPLQSETELKAKRKALFEAMLKDALEG